MLSFFFFFWGGGGSFFFPVFSIVEGLDKWPVIPRVQFSIALNFNIFCLLKGDPETVLSFVSLEKLHYCSVRIRSKNSWLTYTNPPTNIEQSASWKVVKLPRHSHYSTGKTWPYKKHPLNPFEYIKPWTPNKNCICLQHMQPFQCMLFVFFCRRTCSVEAPIDWKIWCESHKKRSRFVAAEIECWLCETDLPKVVVKTQCFGGSKGTSSIFLGGWVPPYYSLLFLFMWPESRLYGYFFWEWLPAHPLCKYKVYFKRLKLGLFTAWASAHSLPLGVANPSSFVLVNKGPIASVGSFKLQMWVMRCTFIM